MRSDMLLRPTIEVRVAAFDGTAIGGPIWSIVTRVKVFVQVRYELLLGQMIEFTVTVWEDAVLLLLVITVKMAQEMYGLCNVGGRRVEYLLATIEMTYGLSVRPSTTNCSTQELLV
jgi:hypothetical protein